MTVLAVTSLAEAPERLGAVEDLYDRGWPAFMSADPVDLECWPQLLELAPHLQLLLLEGERVVATAHATPLAWDPAQPLPDRGWDWALSTGIAHLRAGRAVTAVSALAITIDHDRRGDGLGTVMVGALRDHARQSGARWLVAPLRPSRKSAEPLVPFDEYVARVRDDGLPADPWLRSHVRLGARVGPICERSMTISAPVSQWEAWSGVRYRPGEPYIIPGGLVPVNVEGDAGTYQEPNLWVIHDL
jgi:hypothetical protein